MSAFRKISPWLILLFSFLTCVQCRQSHEERKKENPSGYKETLIQANKEVVRTENEQINDFIHRYGWNMDTTSTGLRIMVVKRGIGPFASEGKTVKLDYVLTLLTGDTVYSARVDGPLVFRVGKGEVISGLEEAILNLRVGDHAKIIIPSHLAYGLIGDQKKIRHKATLVYDLEFISMY